MSTILRSILILCLISSCSFGNFRKPIDYDNACSILAGNDIITEPSRTQIVNGGPHTCSNGSNIL